MGAEFFRAGRQTEGPKDRRRDEKMEGKTDRHEAANSRFEHFCESSFKHSSITSLFSKLRESNKRSFLQPTYLSFIF